MKIHRRLKKTPKEEAERESTVHEQWKRCKNSDWSVKEQRGADQTLGFKGQEHLAAAQDAFRENGT